jgi:hypothetical protein
MAELEPVRMVMFWPGLMSLTVPAAAEKNLRLDVLAIVCVPPNPWIVREVAVSAVSFPLM